MLAVPVGRLLQTRLVETLSPLQQYILELLQLPPSCYDLSATVTLPLAKAV